MIALIGSDSQTYLRIVSIKNIRSLRKKPSHSVRVCRDGRRVCGMTESIVHLQLLALLKLTGYQTSNPIFVRSA
jgi:hypothetical protein